MYIEGAAGKAVVTGALAAATASASGAELCQTVIVGLIGGAVGWMKRYDHDNFKENPIECAMKIPYSLMVPTALTGIVYFLGVNYFNEEVKDVGNIVWTFIGFLAALHYDSILESIGSLVPGLAEKFGIKSKTKKDSTNNYEDYYDKEF